MPGKTAQNVWKVAGPVHLMENRTGWAWGIVGGSVGGARQEVEGLCGGGSARPVPHSLAEVGREGQGDRKLHLAPQVWVKEQFQVMNECLPQQD